MGESGLIETAEGILGGPDRLYKFEGFAAECLKCVTW